MYHIILNSLCPIVMYTGDSGPLENDPMLKKFFNTSKKPWKRAKALAKFVGKKKFMFVIAPYTTDS